MLNTMHLNQQAAMEREVELEHRAVDASTALARLQVWRELYVFVRYFEFCQTKDLLQ